MSWYRPHNVWEGIAAGLIAVTGSYMVADTIKTRNEARFEEWRAAYREAQVAADTDGDGQLDQTELGDLRKKLGFQGEFGSGTLVSGPQPSKKVLERVIKEYNQERRVAESEIGQTAGITGK